MTGRIIKKWMSLLLAVTMLISMASLNVSASETDKTYQAYDASKHRKVISKNGTTDSEWSLCMDHHKKTPGETDKATGEYSKNENATKDTYTSNGGKGDFQKIKRMLFYKLTHPELNYQVLQNEYYYQQDNKTNKNYGILLLNDEYHFIIGYKDIWYIIDVFGNFAENTYIKLEDFIDKYKQKYIDKNIVTKNQYKEILRNIYEKKC